MGGFGSGRKFGADCTDDYRSIDVRRWQRDGYLMPGQHLDCQWTRNGEKVAAISVKVEIGQLRLIYSYRRNGDDWESLDYPVCLQTTACNYGGERYWFTCPAAGCGRRVAVLFLGGKIFACRHCYRLAYKSQREACDDRATRKADKIRDKLNWEPGILNLPGDKPKGMHWKTYLRLMEEYKDYANQALLGMTAKMRIVNNRLWALCDRQ
ncbi:conserved hypothetical protein [Candidatus Methylobacter favarea]|uniref:Uncharacterized protein n=1 Tax=Candidatus Methylobacter favarea TaxID=2707345 RepID=A0A8S0WNE2_9GAMM|nr:hypothetical protein [Candidatus Methylobacter favarea]CAA9890312.1 conserved hypothetical protein [Candidatus Methylobacter favarea]